MGERFNYTRLIYKVVIKLHIGKYVRNTYNKIFQRYVVRIHPTIFNNYLIITNNYILKLYLVINFE